MKNYFTHAQANMRWLLLLVLSSQLSFSQTCTLVNSPGSANGVNFTHTSTGGVRISSIVENVSSCSITPPANSYLLGNGLFGNAAPFTYTYIFSQPVNNVVIAITGTGSGAAGSGNEVFTLTSNGGTPSITSSLSCLTTVSGNVITSGASSTSNGGLGGGGYFKISSPASYTTLTISGPGPSNLHGSSISICSQSIVPACITPSSVAISGTNTYCQNAAASTLSSSYSGNAATAYQWFAGGAAISGATGSTYTPPTTTAGTVNYQVQVFNACGNATSGNYPVTVNATPGVPTLTKVDPSCSVATGSINVTSPVSGATYGLVQTGATNTTGTFAGLAPGTYTVNVTTGGGCYANAAPITISAVPTCGAQLSVKVLLEAPMISATTMNALQTTDFGSLLPQASPYSAAPATYANFAAAGTIADWIWVQVVSASDINNVLEQKSLLLKSDGTMVGLDGLATAVTFTAQTNVRIAIRHRNHLAIFSNPIASFTGAVSYDFTTGANKALTPAGYPAQEVSPYGGTFAMWSSDVNSDNSIDGSDQSSVQVDFDNAAYGSYLLMDINLDGSVDGIDQSFTQKNFDLSIYGNF